MFSTALQLHKPMLVEMDYGRCMTTGSKTTYTGANQLQRIETIGCIQLSFSILGHTIRVITEDFRFGFVLSSN
jgi:hypothetical protein